MFCRFCGSNIADDAEFCRFCGKKLSVDAGAAPVQPEQQQTPPPVQPAPQQAPQPAPMQYAPQQAPPPAKPVQNASKPRRFSPVLLVLIIVTAVVTLALMSAVPVVLLSNKNLFDR